MLRSGAGSEARFGEVDSQPVSSYNPPPGGMARIAQLVEQLICNQPVGGSSPSAGSGMRQNLWIFIDSALSFLRQ